MSVHLGTTHVLVISPRDPGDDFDCYVEHLADCSVETEHLGGALDIVLEHHTCSLGNYESYQGLDGLVDDEGRDYHDWEPGRYLIRTWSEYFAYCNEWDGGLELLGKEGEVNVSV